MSMRKLEKKRKRKVTEVDETKNDPPEIISYCLWLLFLQCFSKRLEHHHLDSICCICWPHSKKENCAIICCCGDLKKIGLKLRQSGSNGVRMVGRF